MPVRFNRLLFVSFAAVVASFFAAGWVVQRASSRINELAAQITQNSGPSIERLGVLRNAVLRAEIAFERVLERSDGAADAQFEAELAQAERAVNDYLALPPLPREAQARQRVTDAWRYYEWASRHAHEEAGAQVEGAALDREVARFRSASQDLLNAASAAIDLSGRHGRQMAEEIAARRAETLTLARWLNALCGLFAGFVAWLLYKESRTVRQLAQSQAQALQARAAELEMFAGRVAHDIRNPLSAARLSSELALRKSTETGAQASISGALRSLSRADAIISALLDFARAGAKPDPGARVEPRELVEEVVADLGPQAEAAGIELRAQALPPCLVACSRGVYLSALGNLVRNAMKYMGETGERRVVVQVQRLDDFVRTSVLDTGPGLRAELLPGLFNPYFRAEPGRAEGLGLGLATVKKLVEGHGGRVGVQSEPGQGSTFWFELPYAGSRESARDVEAQPTTEAAQAQDRTTH